MQGNVELGGQFDQPDMIAEIKQTLRIVSWPAARLPIQMWL
jgi:hypothetical protein